MENPCISVVLPVYNGEKHLRASMDSVLAQGFTDFEMIIWNDAATDSSESIIASYQSPLIRSFRNQQNKGLFPTLNASIAQSRAPWIKLWAQDDVMKPNCLQKHWDFLSRHPETGICYCDIEIIDDAGSWVKSSNLIITPQVMNPDLATRVLFFYGCVPSNICNVTLKKEALDKVGGFREDMKVSGDFEMWTRISQEYGITRILEPLICLRNHEGQLSQRKESLLDFVTEDPQIYSALFNRLNGSEKLYALKYHRFRQHRLYIHFLMLCLTKLNWRTAKKIYDVVKRLERPFPLFLLWFISLNGRLFKMPLYPLKVSTSHNTKETDEFIL